MDAAEITRATLEAIMTARQNPVDIARTGEGITQSSTATTGYTQYDLDTVVKFLYPVLTPLRNRIPRVSGRGGIQANWKAITGINVAGMRGLVGEGNRGGAIKHTLVEYLAAYRGLGLENFVTFEADYAATGMTPEAKAAAVKMLLEASLVEEERMVLGGNTSIALGTTPTPTCADIATGGTLAAATAYKIGCVALTHEGWRYSAVDATGCQPSITKTNTDGSTDTFNGGTAQQSAVATCTTASDGNATHSISAYVTPVRGAVAYAWYWGITGASTMYLGAITTKNSLVITATADSGNQAYNATGLNADHSRNAMAFDGLLSLALTSTSGAYYRDLATGTPGTGTALTSDGASGVVEIDTALKAFWDNYRLSPTDIYCDAGTALAINKLVIANGGAPLVRFGLDGAGVMMVTAGVVVGNYLNKTTQQLIKITVHPDMPNGTILFFSDTVPYPLANVTNLVQIRTRREWYQTEWPLRTRKWEYGTYADEVLQHFFPPSMGVIKNIATGY